MIYIIAALAGVFGLLVGSFLNVVIYRVPIGKSVVHPASACPNCGHGIVAYDNVPVLSWLALRGKCRNCSEPISARYPLVELGTGLFFFVVALPLAGQFSFAQPTVDAIASGVTLVAFLYLAAISVALAFIDLEHHRLPDAIVLPSYLVGVLLLSTASILSGDFTALIRAAIGLGAMTIAYFILAVAWKGSMGFGDVKLAGVLGLFLGWSGWGALLVGSIGAFFLGGIFGLVLIVLRKTTRKSGIPFGPWMVLGAWIGILFGNQLWTDYLSVFGLNV
ncbi:MAG: leader peptidase (prepilin peptidase) / N-methyltransferase [Actinomycetota bacterium]|jgi:leader peptidase (prepilin peptidase)/N-methyltransferase|nr:leader peptidase (prepilin peptidase) / N-methyltransferase [Actinomycetota bacterium]MDQ1550619.1 leader peptidase (prepilin peptidase) / N-methyltransferase [Actinomycetota bacterium]